MRTWYDCSNSEEAPSHHPHNNGPKQNDIVYGLKQYGCRFGWECVSDPKSADVLFTNDIYPAEILKLNKPKIKRMDGVYWYKNLVERNKPLNLAAQQSDQVIFISNYSMQSYVKLYMGNAKEIEVNKLKNSSVILNCVDDNIYFPYYNETPKTSLFASASNWIRPEKRFKDLMSFMETIATDYSLHLVGQCDMSVPENVFKHGYVNSGERVNDIINQCSAMINFSYRDAAPKAVCQAVNCRLPIFFAASGGTPELVKSGIGVPDNELSNFENIVPKIDELKLIESWNKFKENEPVLSKNAQYTKNSFMNMLYRYFEVFRLTLE